MNNYPPSESKPSFWLQIKKEYVIENFEELVNYICKYIYRKWDINNEFDATVECLNELSEELGRKLMSTPVYEQPDLGEIDLDMAGRIFAVTIFAYTKMDRPFGNSLLYLIKVMTLTRAAATEENLKKYLAITFNCMRGLKIDSLGFGPRDLSKESYLINLPTSLTRLTFKDDSAVCSQRLVENHGICMASDDGYVDLAPMNYEDYYKAMIGIDSLKTQIEIADKIRLRLRAGDYTRLADYETTDAGISNLLKIMDGVRPSPKATMKKYRTKQENVMVKVLKVEGMRIEAETVNPNFERVRGKLFVVNPAPGRPASDVFRKFIQPGSYVLADYDPTSPVATFFFKEDFEDYFRRVASDKANTEEYVVYDSDYSKGTIWITRDGVRVSVETSKLDGAQEEVAALFERAIDDGKPIKIKFYVNPPDFDADNFRMFAQPCEESCYIGADSYFSKGMEYFTPEEADEEIVKSYLDECRHDAEVMLGGNINTFNAADPMPLKVATCVFNAIIPSLSSSIERLEYLGISLMLSKMTDSEADFTYFQHVRSYLGKLVTFAHNKDVSPLRADESIAGLDFVTNHIDIIEKLSSYRRERNQQPDLSDLLFSRLAKDNDTLEKVKTLIDASNSLIDIIDTSEVNNIKQKITRLLNVDDEYVNILDNRTFYGQESISLELKKSIVYPPANRRRFSAKFFDPDLQKWEILKAVCGFLNSRAGGELLLGVSDDGYAWGIEQDIKGLLQHNMIKSDDPDQYRHYVQRVLTCAFRSKSGNYESSDIARLCISYSIEDNLENKTILRIKVNPYPYDVVEIALDDIPTGYVNAYLRQSGETARLTEALRRNVEVYKRNALKNTSSFDVLLQQALEERNVVELVDYQSASKCATRRIHVYKLWPRRQLIYGYDLDRKAPRLFKTTRCRQIVLTDETWKKHLASPDAQIDVFGMLVDKDNIRNLEMLLNDYAKAILIEEYPGAEGHIIPNYGSDRSAYPWRLICRTSNPAGLLRFSRGLPDATKLNENQLVETV